MSIKMGHPVQGSTHVGGRDKDYWSQEPFACLHHRRLFGNTRSKLKKEEWSIFFSSANPFKDCCPKLIPLTVLEKVYLIGAKF